MLRFLTLLVSWWSGTTIGTNWYTRRKGEKVGEDEFGNIYYRTRGGAIDPALGFERRWVIYNGISEASAIPPGWHGWMHHKVDVAPVGETYTVREWQKPHQANLTGSAFAYRPRGSLLSGGKGDGGITRPDYEAWSPER
jgi:NADH:ubiquinone oxidoreductase subunit